MRLDKLLSQQLGMSRRNAMRELKMGKVTVNSEIIKIGGCILTAQDKIVYEGVELENNHTLRYVMLCKPKGYVCGKGDPHHPSVNYLLDEWSSDKLFAVGRLDVDTTGLVLLTDDGEWAHRIASPRYHCTKCYRVTLFDAINDNTITQFAQGVLLKGERELTLPVTVEVINSHEVRVALSEGRYHQVKRMFAALGNHVVQLHRESIGGVYLDPKLDEGQYRSLTEVEQQLLYLKK